MAGSTALIARRSIRARLGRTIAIVFAVVAGVSFVAGSFVLADSLTRSFDGLIEDLVQDVDLQVRGLNAFEDDSFGSDNSPPPVPIEIVDQLDGIDGIAVVEPDLTARAQILNEDGQPITVTGPMFGTQYETDTLAGVEVKDGRAPMGPDELVVDAATATREGLDVGDPVSYSTDTGIYTGTLVGTVGTPDSDSFLGSSIVALDLETALDRYGTNGLVDQINIGLEDGADIVSVESSIVAAVGDDYEIVDRDTLIEEFQDQIGQFIGIFGTGLLIFAFVTAFVAAFIINNVFQITIGQRLRELALLRAIGASGKQVRRMITLEALGVGIAGTIIGVLAGLGVAQMIVLAFNAAGAGFPSSAPVLLPRTILVSAIVGIGVTMVSVIVPARRAAKIPPVAAMRPELGFAAIRSRRLVVGAVTATIGLAMLLIGLFVSPGGTVGLIVLGGGGTLLLFLGVASVSATVATPVTRAIGWPVAKLFKTPGKLARDNVARAPRRTSSSAAALMIGVALVSAAAVFASSLRVSISAALERSVSADYIVQGSGGAGGGPGDGGFPPVVVETLAELPEIETATPFRVVTAQVDDDSKVLTAVDPQASAQLVDFDNIEGSFDDLSPTSLAVHDEAAESADLEFGDTATVTFQNGEVRDLTVDLIFGDNSFGLNWFIDLELLDEISGGETQSDVFALAALKDDVDPDEGDAAVRAAFEQFPQASVQSNAEFLQEQEDQINQLLFLIAILLLFAIVIAVIGISITLALGVYERTREIGLLRAVGMSKRQTRKSVRWEAVIVSVFGALIGVVLGTFLGVVLSEAVPESIISDLAFSPMIIIMILIGAVIAGLLAALYPSYKASNMNVLDAIATE
ncbi:ABC transporter permease [Ilumatobacter nonamiensis]|uniref:ABC transporter permease n=1 Tax=Ilumatobacter nonamiensis TaxID=467093 RepID=UPI00034DE7C2|nr:ABC transporter permease [Ilumatobacter nonamiensis]